MHSRGHYTYIVARKVGGLPFACRRSWRVNRRSMKTVSKTNRAEGDGGFRSRPAACLRARMHAAENSRARSRVDNSKNCIPRNCMRDIRFLLTAP